MEQINQLNDFISPSIQYFQGFQSFEFCFVNMCNIVAIQI